MLFFNQNVKEMYASRQQESTNTCNKHTFLYNSVFQCYDTFYSCKTGYDDYKALQWSIDSVLSVDIV